MTNGAADALLTLMVLAAWLSAAGFARLRDPLDRLHCVTFVNVVAGGALTAAAVAADGASVRAGKLALAVGISLLAGAATSHAIGRALTLRAAGADADADAAGRGGDGGAEAAR